MSTNSERLSNINPEAFNNDKCAHEILLNQVIIAFEKIEALEKEIAALKEQISKQQEIKKNLWSTNGLGLTADLIQA